MSTPDARGGMSSLPWQIRTESGMLSDGDALVYCSIPQSGIVIRCGPVSCRLPAEVNAINFFAIEMVGTPARFSTDGVKSDDARSRFPVQKRIQ